MVGISGPATVQVLDLAGRVMMNEQRWESDGRLLLEDLPAGHYHLFIKGMESVTTVPFVVVR